MEKTENHTIDVVRLTERFERSKKRRAAWESHWKECYDYALPQREGFSFTNEGSKRTGQIFDATAVNAVDQLAASLLAELTPPWSRWFNLKPGPELDPAEAERVAPLLEKASIKIQDQFDRSNFVVEMHQCYLDLVTAGTASLLFEEAAPGEFSAFHFAAVPLSQVYMEEGVRGALDGTFRLLSLSRAQVLQRFDAEKLPASILRDGQEYDKIKLVEAVLPREKGYDYTVFIADGLDRATIIEHGFFVRSPFINFRWVKSPGEIYGRSPVMKCLPDIKTANKVVELILKNASIAVTGIWQADDDGILNPANIKLVPGAIIPKAVGSAGLQPLDMPAKFDVSQLVLEDLRGRIRNGLMADRLSQIEGRRMTATEVLERSAEIARLLGASYGRLQAELLTPLIMRAYSILRRRGEIPDLDLDGRIVSLDYTSPLARAQAQRDTQNMMSWVQNVLAMGEAAVSVVDIPKVSFKMGQSLGVPSDVLKNPDNNEAQMVDVEKLSQLAQAVQKILTMTEADNVVETQE